MSNIYLHQHSDAICHKHFGAVAEVGIYSTKENHIYVLLNIDKSTYVCVLPVEV